MCRCQERTNARNAHMVSYECTDVRNIYSRCWKVYMPGMYRCQGMCRCQEYTDARDVQRPRMYRRQGCTNAGDVQMKRDLQMPGMYICCDAQMPGMYICQGMYMYARDVQMPGMYRWKGMYRCQGCTMYICCDAQMPGMYRCQECTKKVQMHKLYGHNLHKYCTPSVRDRTHEDKLLESCCINN